MNDKRNNQHFKGNKDPFLEELGRNVRFHRQRKGLTQETLAHDAGLDRTYIGCVERGEMNISVLNLKYLAEVLDVKVSELLPLEDEK